jgi:hypothetical protein
MPIPNQFTGLQAYRPDTGRTFKPRSGFESWLFGNPETFRQKPRYTPEIQGNVNEVLQQGFQGLQNPYQGFQNIANEATHQYNTQTIPGLAERFAAVPGGQRSSAFQAALGGSGEDLQRSLAALKEQFGMQNRESLLNQIGFGLKNQPEFEHLERQGGALENILAPLLGGTARQYGGEWGNAGGNLISILGRLLPFLL